MTTNPDELILDNLRYVFESGATGVEVKTTHADLLDEHVNIYIVEKGLNLDERVVPNSSVIDPTTAGFRFR